MTQQEFEERTGRAVKAEDYFIIEKLYMATNMDKDEFCKEFKEMNDSVRPGIRQSLREIANRLGMVEAQNATLTISIRKRDGDLADFLIGKAHAYETIPTSATRR